MDRLSVWLKTAESEYGIDRLHQFRPVYDRIKLDFTAFAHYHARSMRPGELGRKPNRGEARL